MRCSFIATLAAALLSSTSAAIQVSQHDASPAIVSLRTQRKTVEDPVERDTLRRRQTVTEALNNEKTLYYANVSLGTPAQGLRLHLDTGSSDLWANVASSDICAYQGNPCSNGGTYDANSSITYRYLNSDFNVSYVDGSGAAGDYGTDTLTIGGQTLTGLQFGIGYESTSADGILGIGYAADEAQANTAHLKSYANLPQALVNAGMVKSNAYSLWLDDYQASTGSIIFGGIDIDKYTGRLYTLPIQEEFSEYAEFIITLTSMSIIDSGENQSLDTDLPTAVVLDSGSSLTYLPNANAIYAALNVEYSQLNGAAFATCNLASENITLDFTFTSATISIPIRELVLSTDSIEEGQEEPSFGRDSYSSRGSDEICLFGIAPSQGSTPVLGDTFLRSAYVVYDLANNEISLAQTNFKSTTTHIVEIGVGTGSVPGAIPVISAVEASVSQSGGPRIAGVSGTVTGGSLATSTNSAESMHVAYGGFAAAAGLWAAVACT